MGRAPLPSTVPRKRNSCARALRLVLRGWQSMHARMAAHAVWLLATLCIPSLAEGQTANLRPFGVGERLVFVVSTARSSKIGDAVMTLSGPIDVRGTQAVVASFDTDIRVAMLKASNKTKSWFDARDMTSLRFTKHERRPFASQDDSAEVFPDRHRWESAHDVTSPVSSDHPLDELSFIYFLRTTFFEPDSTYSFERHYDARRSPTTVRVVKHETLRTRAGKFETTVLEMRVKDAPSTRAMVCCTSGSATPRAGCPSGSKAPCPCSVGILTLDSAVTPSCRADDPQPATIKFSASDPPISCISQRGTTK